MIKVLEGIGLADISDNASIVASACTSTDRVLFHDLTPDEVRAWATGRTFVTAENGGRRMNELNVTLGVTIPSVLTRSLPSLLTQARINENRRKGLKNAQDVAVAKALEQQFI